MVNTELDFHKRLTMLGRKHAAMAKGYVMRMRPDGLIVVHLKSPGALRLFPLRGLMVLTFGFLLIKAFMLTSIGELSYNERVTKLGQGTAIEKGGAWIMQIDPATAVFAGFLKNTGS